MKIILLANTSWALYQSRIPLAKKLHADGHEVVMVSPHDQYTHYLTDAGFRWMGFSLSQRGYNILQEISTFLHILQIYRKEKPDIVHHFTIKCVLYGSIAARLLHIKRIINSITGMGYVFSDSHPSKYILQSIIRLLYRLSLHGTTLIFQNPDDRALFIEQKWIDPQSSHLIRSSGVDLDYFVPSTKPDGTVNILLPARMLKDKGIHIFVEAARLLKQNGVPCQMILAGDSDGQNPDTVSPAQLTAWHREGIVEWLGWLNDMRQLYERTDIVCLPTYYREGVPRSLIEGAACGLPLVATDIPGCREVVKHNQNGLLVPARDSRALYNALRQLIYDSELRKRMGGKSREISEQFSIEHVVAETIRLYFQ